MFATALFVLVQSATPFGSPVDPVLMPSKPKDTAAASEVQPAPAEPVDPKEARFYNCVDLAIDDPAGAIVEANSWRIQGGGFLARHCLGFAHAEHQSWPAATKAFAEAAREAEVARDERAAQFWAQAGNAALAGGEFAKALEYLNAALVQGSLEGLAKGEVHLDRARAHVALDDYDAAKAEFALVHELAPQDPLGWLLSATLARRQNDLSTAKADIGEAAKLAPRDSAIALEAGNIAYSAGDAAGAKINWEQAAKINPDGAPAQAAKKYLAQLVTSVKE